MTKITEVTVMPVRPKDGLVAIASFVLETDIGTFKVGSIGIYVRQGGGYSLSYPIKKIGSNRYEIFKPTTREAGSAIEEAILDEHERLLTKDVTEVIDER